MKVKKVLRLLDVVEKLPSDIRHMLYEEDTSMDMDGAYFSVSQNRYVPVIEMDFVHVLRSFMQLNEYNKENREGYLLIERIKEKHNAK
tara:strand:+ start:498 stop:761 length:264 start_codon:yes stop_codon:yes gene_type:complete